ncbi:hypothetical protein C8Q79DRAFT_969643 [Trametes meyenii]|nr:hypothetical protein C8Q79DRAFT_969643 [Trametes meyenii]
MPEPPSCSKCSVLATSQPDTSSTSTRPGIYHPGSVCSIRTSDPKAMAYDILEISQPSFTTRPQRTSGNAEIVRAGRNRVIQGPRPCVVLKPASSRPGSRSRKRESRLGVCLMGTFIDEDIESLPEILKFFAIPVCPHFLVDGSVNGFSIIPHIHTSPQWARNNTWILAYIHMIERDNISGLWVHDDDNDDDGQDSPGITYYLDEHQLSAFLVLCEEKKKAWDSRVQSDPDFVQRCLRELEVGRRSRLAMESPPTRYSRAKSRSPVRTKEGKTTDTILKPSPVSVLQRPLRPRRDTPGYGLSTYSAARSDECKQVSAMPNLNTIDLTTDGLDVTVPITSATPLPDSAIPRASAFIDAVLGVDTVATAGVLGALAMEIQDPVPVGDGESHPSSTPPAVC